MAIQEEFHYNRYIADSSIAKINENHESPFFIWCSFPDPHAPCAPPKPYCDMYRPEDIPLPISREGELDDLPPFYQKVIDGELRPNGVDNRNIKPEHWQQLIAMTYGMITHLDAEIGRVLDALELSGKRDNTIIAFIADHGDMMGDHGLLWKSFYTFKGCSNIQFILSPPDGLKENINPHLISQIDLMPSILDLCNIPVPGSDWQEANTSYERGALVPLKTYPGKSAKEMLLHPNASIRDSVVIENDDPTMGFRVRCLVTENYRMAIYPETEHGELFDLLTDPDDCHNLWYKKDYQAIKNELILKLLNDYSKETPLYPIPVSNS